MTRLLERAFEAARDTSPAMQDELARLLLSYLGEGGTMAFPLTPDDEAAVRESRDAFRSGDVASDSEVAAIWTKHGL